MRTALALAVLVAATSASAYEWERVPIEGSDWTVAKPVGAGVKASSPMEGKLLDGGEVSITNFSVSDDPKDLTMGLSFSIYRVVGKGSGMLKGSMERFGKPTMGEPETKKHAGYKAIEAGWRVAKEKVGAKTVAQNETEGVKIPERTEDLKIVMYEIALDDGALTLEFNAPASRFKEALPMYVKMRDSLLPSAKKKRR